MAALGAALTYLDGDARGRVRLSSEARTRLGVRFNDEARGVPHCAHGGAIGAAHLTSRTLPAGGTLQSIALEYLARTRLNEELELRARPPGADARLVVSELLGPDGTLLSRAQVACGPPSPALVPSPGRLAGAARAALARCGAGVLRPVPVPDFAVARYVDPALPEVHFEFHNHARQRFEGWRVQRGTTRRDRGGDPPLRGDPHADADAAAARCAEELHCLLHCDASRCASDLCRDRLSEGALLVAVDEALGAAVSLAHPVPLVTGRLALVFHAPVALLEPSTPPASPSAPLEPLTLYLRVSVAERRPGSRRVEGRAEVYALERWALGRAESLGDLAACLPRLCSAEATFVLAADGARL
jgi:hypothetical protein